MGGATASTAAASAASTTAHSVIAAEEPLSIEAPTRSNPYAEGTEVTSRPATAGERFNMVYSEGQTNPGGFGASKTSRTKPLPARSWRLPQRLKPDVSFVQQFEFPGGSPIQIQEGTVGSQEFGNATYPGGASQLEILNWEDRARLIPIGEPIPLLDLEAGG